MDWVYIAIESEKTFGLSLPFIFFSRSQTAFFFFFLTSLISGSVGKDFPQSWSPGAWTPALGREPTNLGGRDCSPLTLAAPLGSTRLCSGQAQIHLDKEIMGSNFDRPPNITYYIWGEKKL